MKWLIITHKLINDEQLEKHKKVIIIKKKREKEKNSTFSKV